VNSFISLRFILQIASEQTVVETRWIEPGLQLASGVRQGNHFAVYRRSFDYPQI